MRATLLYGAGDVRLEHVPDPAIREPTDAVVRVVRACVCGSDLHPFHSLPASAQGTPMGLEFLGVVEDVGADVRTVARGDFVISPFAYQDNTCAFCRAGFQTSCVHGGFYGANGVGGGQAEAIRIPQADGTRRPCVPDIEDVLPDVLAGHLTPALVFDRTVPLDDVADGYRAMDEREALKVMVAP